MNIVCIIGSHKRHAAVVDQLYARGYLSALVVERCGDMVPAPPSYLGAGDRQNFIHHFQLRDECEREYFGHIDLPKISRDVPSLNIEAGEVNSDAVLQFLKAQKPDLIFSYGCGLINDSILDAFPNRFFNVHGGLSHWYKGAATIFWPFYFLEPNYAGMTIHRTVRRIDAGDILHHSRPVLCKGDRMHDVACKGTLKVAADLADIVEKLEQGRPLECVPQRKNGKLFLERDWKPEMLRMIYTEYEDKIVDLFLDGVICSPEPVGLVQF